jgi:predicted nucleotidyltransferase
MDKNNILEQLSKLKDNYTKEGVNILGMFGSYAKGTPTINSDIDIAYSLNKDLFFQRYSGFATVSRISNIRDELSAVFHKKVDLISLENSNILLTQEIKKDIIYV